MSWRDYILADDPKKPKPVAPAVAAPATQSLGVAPSTVVNVDNQFVTALRNAIKARPTAYTALLSAADKLANIIPDANTRLKAAYATTGRAVSEVLGALDVHIADLESQRMQFQAALDKTKQDALGAMQRELDNLKPSSDAALAQITTLTNQIQQLQTLIGNNNTRTTELQTTIATKTNEFASSEQQFGQALTIVKNELDGQKAIIQSALS